jgi:fructokinase
MRAMLGAIEGGGTKFNLLIGTGPDDIVEETRFPTTTPAETLERSIEFFRRPRRGIRIAAVGVASFGPIDLDRASPTYGFITTTPKPHWAHTDVVGSLAAALGVPIGWDTDVNGAALGERRWGAGRDADPLVYITVGTGIGGGAVVQGRPLHGLLHPEMGHLPMPALEGDAFAGICPYHGRCLEGLACGPALQARLGRPAQEVGPDDPVWELEAQYLAYGLFAISVVLSPQRIVVGGGVAGAPGLLDRVRRHLARVNSGYIARPALNTELETYVVPPGLGTRAGVLGALELARAAYESSTGA